MIFSFIFLKRERQQVYNLGVKTVVAGTRTIHSEK